VVSMLTIRLHKSVKAVAIATLLLLVSHMAQTQDAVSFLKAETVNEPAAKARLAAGVEQAFSFTRNLIFFEARVNGKQGNFILDTGAPTLLLNNRGNTVGHPAPTGLAAGGTVSLENQLIESFEMGGRSLGKRWALAMDLRSMEDRTGQTIDGFVGHEILRQGELRINFPGRKFRLLKSTRRPRHEGQAPVTVLKFQFIDHLPVITLRVGKQKLRFVIDTGAGANLVDKRFRDVFTPTGTEMNIQGLDGDNEDYSIVLIPELRLEGDKLEQATFVAMDLSHLQSPGQPLIAGILGSVFLADRVVGIDYRKRKINLW
jgi:hypothetical protein